VRPADLSAAAETLVLRLAEDMMLRWPIETELKTLESRVLVVMVNGKSRLI